MNAPCRMRRQHNVREDVVKDSRWVPFAASQGKASGLTVLATPDPSHTRVWVQTDTGRKSTPLLTSLLQDYHRVALDGGVTNTPLAPPAVVAESLPAPLPQNALRKLPTVAVPRA